MPAKNSKAARQAARRRRPSTRGAGGATSAAGERAVSDSLFPTPSLEAPGERSVTFAPSRARARRDEVPAIDAPAVASARAGAAPTAPQRTAAPRIESSRAAGRPAPSSSLESEQVRNEVRYIRSDITRLLLTTAAVAIFMVLANILLN